MPDDPIRLVDRNQVVAAISSRRFVLLPDGTEAPLDGNGVVPDVAATSPVLARLLGSRHDGVREAPRATIETLKRLEWGAYEPASDHSQLRYYPKGALVYSLLRDWHEAIIRDRLQASEIRTPLLYDWSRPDLRSQAATFFDRLYYVRGHGSERELVLRFGGDFGLFCMLKDARLTYRHLPLRLFEYAPSFRYERRGELKGLLRTRAFSFFDVHSVCADFEQGWQDYLEMYRCQATVALQLGLRYVAEFTIVGSEFERYRPRLHELVAEAGEPAIVEVLTRPKHYWAIRHVFRRDDGHKFFTSQLDFENSLRYGITYTGPDGRRRGCIICHTSLSSIERWIFLSLEQALHRPEPCLPLWLSPTQLRLIPVTDTLVPAAVAVASHLADSRVRVDVDDRTKTIGWKVREAAGEWVPYTVVYGEREARGGAWAVRRRGGRERRLTPVELLAEIDRERGTMPYRPLSPLLLSRRPRFV